MNDLAEKCADCPDKDASLIERFQADFGLPCLMTQRQQKALYDAIADIVDSPWNQPKDGVHWPAGSGSMPRWSRADAAFLGKPADGEAPASGEPTFDDTVFYIECCARAFTGDEERKRVEKRRAKQWVGRVCPDCGPVLVAVEVTESGRPVAGRCLTCDETIYFA